MSVNIPIIVGTSRKGSKSRFAAEFVQSILEERPNMVTRLVDPGEYILPEDGNAEQVRDTAYGELIKDADAFILVVPEYNHSFSGSLKRLLDSEYGSYTHKAVALVGVSAGDFGGVRAIQSLVPALREMGAVVTFTDMYVTKSYERFNANGDIVADRKQYVEAANRMIDELLWMNEALTYGRKNIISQYHQEGGSL